MTAVLASTRWGPMLVPPSDEYVGQALIRLGQYAPAEFATWIPYLPVGGVVLDVGANMGAHTVAFAAAVGTGGHVFAIEPQRMLYYMLCGTLALNHVLHVHAKHAAAGREIGQINVPLLDFGAPQNFGALALRDAFPEDAPTEPVPVIPVDALQLQRLDFVKVDVEGMELDVLHGAEQTIDAHRPVLSVEADREQNVLATLAVLKRHGYRAWWHRPPLGPLWPRMASVNLLAVHTARELPDPADLDEALV